MRSAPLPMWPRASILRARHRRSAGVALQHDRRRHQGLTLQRCTISLNPSHQGGASAQCRAGVANRLHSGAARLAGSQPVRLAGRARHFSSFRSLRPGAGESRAGPPAGSRGCARNGEARASRYGRRLDVLRGDRIAVVPVSCSRPEILSARDGDAVRTHVDSVILSSDFEYQSGNAARERG